MTIAAVADMQAAAPTNDLCSGAIVIPDAGPFPFFSPITPEITSCTTNGDPPLPSCGVSPSRSIWYKFTPSTTALYVFSVGNGTATTVSDTLMAIYSTGVQGGCGSVLTEVACNDDGSDQRSATAASLTRNRTYFIVVWMFSDTPPDPGTTAVQLKVTRPTAPPNDLCSGALFVPTNGPFPFITATNDIFVANTTGDPLFPSCGNDLSSSVWYRFSPVQTGTYHISTCTEFSGSQVFDTVMAVYSGPSCAGPFKEIACNDDACGPQAALSVPLQAGSNYYILVWNFGSVGPLAGSSDLATRFARVSNPTISTLGASNITATSADLTGLLNPREGIGLLGFEWGSTTNYGNLTDFQEVTGTTNAVLVSYHLDGLLPRTVYHFRALGTNEVGSAIGQDATFMTASPPRFSAAAFLGDGSFRVQFHAASGDLYTVSGSSNLVEWIDLGLAEEIEPTLFQFIHAGASSLPVQFYRVRSP